MARTGRPPKPVELKVISGNPGKRRLPTETIKAPPSKPRRPAWLSRYGRAAWEYVTPELDDLGLLARADRDALAMLCEAAGNFRAATEDVARRGILVEGDKGRTVKNPALQVQRDAARTFATFSSMLGVSPGDRARLLGAAENPTGRGAGGIAGILG